MMKGADSVMVPRLTESCRAKPETKLMLEEMEQYALDGLRTLCIGVREIADDQVKNWLSRFKEVSTTLVEREQKLENLASELERDVELVGISAIEDKLQDNVGDTIDGLRGLESRYGCSRVINSKLLLISVSLQVLSATQACTGW